MTRRAGSAIFILSFALVPWVLEACGMAANVLRDDVPDEGFQDGGWGFGGILMMGAGGAKSTGGGGVSMDGGGTQSVGGRIIVGAGGGPEEAGASIDPNAELRRSLAEELCAIPTRFPCLTLDVSGAPPRATAEELKTLCRQKTESSQYTTFGDRCFDQWASNASCALGRTDYCPCDGDAGACTFSPESHDYGPACATTLSQLSACALYKDSVGTASGVAGDYDWANGQLGCSVHGLARNGIDRIDSSCQGPPGGVQVCSCLVNGMDLLDHVQTLTGLGNTFYADDCRNVAVLLAAGQCADVLDCCFADTANGACDCAAHPEYAGYSSCEELAAASSAVVVDHCPRYRP